MDEELKKKLKKKNIRKISIAMLAIICLAAIAFGMNLEYSDYGRPLTNQIVKAENLAASAKENLGNEQSQYAPYTLEAFQNKICDAKKVSEKKNSNYEEKKAAWVEIKKNISDFKNSMNKDTLSIDEIKALVVSGKTKEFTTNLSSSKKISWKVEGKKISEPTYINFMAKEKGPDYSDVLEFIETLSAQGEIISLYQDGAFGGEIQVTLPMYNDGEKTGYLYEYNLKEKALIYKDSATINTKDDTATFTVTKGGDYVVLLKKLSDDKINKKEIVKVQKEKAAQETAKETAKETSGGGKVTSTTKTTSTTQNTTVATVTPTGGKTVKVTIEIRCDTLADNMSKLEDKALEQYVPKNGTILKTTTYTGTKGDTAFDVLNSVCRNNDIQIESKYTPIYGSYYVKGINYLYEFDAGPESGWMYKVNGKFLNYGCSSYEIKNGDKIVCMYTCNLGKDIGDDSN